uniref:Uncharacterized protein n=1 Tax=Panagrolaimus sp. ES5 TaxID=591445 RepID=A0AC34GEP8_9BILA
MKIFTSTETKKLNNASVTHVESHAHDQSAASSEEYEDESDTSTNSEDSEEYESEHGEAAQSQRNVRKRIKKEIGTSSNVQKRIRKECPDKRYGRGNVSIKGWDVARHRKINSNRCGCTACAIDDAITNNSSRCIK